MSESEQHKSEPPATTAEHTNQPDLHQENTILLHLFTEEKIHSSKKIMDESGQKYIRLTLFPDGKRYRFEDWETRDLPDEEELVTTLRHKETGQEINPVILEMPLAQYETLVKEYTTLFAEKNSTKSFRRVKAVLLGALQNIRHNLFHPNERAS